TETSPADGGHQTRESPYVRRHASVARRAPRSDRTASRRGLFGRPVGFALDGRFETTGPPIAPPPLEKINRVPDGALARSVEILFREGVPTMSRHRPRARQVATASVSSERPEMAPDLPLV